MLSDDTPIIRENILSIIRESRERLTHGRLEKIISKRFSLSRKQIRSILRELVTQGELIYTYQYGCTFLEPSFEKAVRISKHVVLKPHGISYQARPEDVVIEMKHGASFGTGQHPTTRLAIRGIEYALKDCQHFRTCSPSLRLCASARENCQHFSNEKETRLLDIGTGTGVLALVALQLGIHKGIGTDIDPCAKAEARENVALNGLDARMLIRNEVAEDIREPFSLIIANLRYPTLRRLASHLNVITEANGLIILSGIKTDEIPDLLSVYTEVHGFRCIWKETEKDWGGVVLTKKVSISDKKTLTLNKFTSAYFAFLG